MNLNGVLIGSEDPGRLVAYYTKLFGEPSFEAEGYTSWRIGTGWITIGLHDQVHGTNVHPGRVIWNIETPDVRRDFERFVAAGATVVREPYDPGGPDEGPEMLIATFADPDDNYFQLLSPMEMDQGA
jgi:predicted enzyme related to lactoylglutathione lyase